MVQICALASGSNGNCYYIGNEHEAVIVDIGITNRQFTLRMRERNLPVENVKAVFISHEHTDHVQGLRVTATKNNLKTYITKKTYNKCKVNYRSAKACFFEAGEIISVGNIKVYTFKKQHDAVDPVSFRVEIDGMNIAILTDLGVACNLVKEHLAMCDAAFLETNYEHDRLFNGPYPYFLKNRVASEKGHLSNTQAIELIGNKNFKNLKTLILSHISAENNCENVISNCFKPFESSHTIEFSSRTKPSNVIEL